MKRIITDPSGVKSLPHGSVVLTADGTARQKDLDVAWDEERSEWYSAGSDRCGVFHPDDFPLRVLYNPEEDE